MKNDSLEDLLLWMEGNDSTVVRQYAMALREWQQEEQGADGPVFYSLSKLIAAADTIGQDIGEEDNEYPPGQAAMDRARFKNGVDTYAVPAKEQEVKTFRVEMTATVRYEIEVNALTAKEAGEQAVLEAMAGGGHKVEDPFNWRVVGTQVLEPEEVSA